MSNSKSKHNIFLFSPGGYGPYRPRVSFWGDHIEVDADENDPDAHDDAWMDAADDYVYEHARDVDYGVFFMKRESVERLIETLKKLLEEEHE